MLNKEISIQEAVKLIQPGDMLALGGLTLYRRPMAFVRALLSHFLANGQPKELTLLAFTASIESDLLVGSGMIKTVRSCYFGLEIFGLAPMFTFLANQGRLDIMEESEASLAFGLRAQLAGLNFMPGRGWIGTDLPALRPDVKTIIDPYSGETLMAFPAIQPDVAVIHAFQADPAGNASIGKNRAIDVELTMTAKTVIVTAEEIVPELTEADLVAPWVDAVVSAPRGASPTSCHPFYALDGAALLAYSDKVSDPDSWLAFVQQMLSESQDKI